MKKITSKEIALSGIAAAFAVIAVVLSYYVSVLTLAFYALASVALMLPLLAESGRGCVLAYLASAGLSFLFVGYIHVLPYLMMFGPYTILFYYLRKYLKKPYFCIPIKVAFADLSFLAVFYATGLTLADFPIVETLPKAGQYAVIYVVLSAAFIVFDLAFERLYAMLLERFGGRLRS